MNKKSKKPPQKILEKRAQVAWTLLVALVVAWVVIQEVSQNPGLALTPSSVNTP